MLARLLAHAPFPLTIPSSASFTMRTYEAHGMTIVTLTVIPISPSLAYGDPTGFRHRAFLRRYALSSRAAASVVNGLLIHRGKPIDSGVAATSSMRAIRSGADVNHSDPRVSRRKRARC
jgi:hypothetical protein